MNFLATNFYPIEDADTIFSDQMSRNVSALENTFDYEFVRNNPNLLGLFSIATAIYYQALLNACAQQEHIKKLHETDEILEKINNNLEIMGDGLHEIATAIADRNKRLQ